MSVRYQHDGGDVEILPDSRHEEAGRELLAALRQLQPNIGGFLAKRHGVASSVVSLFHEADNGAIVSPQNGTKRSVPVWQWQEIQEVLRGVTRVVKRGARCALFLRRFGDARGGARRSPARKNQQILV